MSTRPGEGERRAASGYRSQYLVGAVAILEALKNGDMESVRVADPEVGRVDDLQIMTTARIDAYQVKWSQYGGTITLGDLTKATDKEPALITQLADGWQRLQTLHPHRRVVVHLVTNKYPSTEARRMPRTTNPPTPYHLAAFIEQAWMRVKQSGRFDPVGPWESLWEALRTASGLSIENFSAFVEDCEFDFRTPLPKEEPDVVSVVNLLFATAAGAERRIEISQNELLRQLGWTRRYSYRNVHEFPAPSFLYRPIQRTVEAVEATLSALSGGYVGVFGSPGAGKSTLLTRTLRALPLRLVRYYAYIPEAQDPSVLRGESTNFLHDVTLRLQQAGFVRTQQPDPSDRSALLTLFHEQLQALGEDHVQTATKTVILVDGLDHIAREQRPERSLVHDLPPPEAIPAGVYLVLGSQTDELPDLPTRVYTALRAPERRIEMGRLSPEDIHAIAQEAVPVLTADQRQRVYELSNGHPLALIYLLKQLAQAQVLNERTELLEEAIPYTGDIEQQYWGHWRAIENDGTLVHTLGLLARVRGPIPMKWVAQWSTPQILRQLRRLLLTYFQQEGESRWVFFHNSFRLFLVRRTGEPLLGQSLDELDRAYHRELAERYEASTIPWRWEAVYHRYRAGEYAAVVAMATPGWFHEQVNALQPLDALQTDARLALRAAGTCKDVTALANLTLIWAGLEQRADTLENHLLPDLLLQAGAVAQAAEHLRDGYRLRVEAEQALRLSVPLREAGMEIEGRQIFELAEPLELLSGRPIPENHTRPQNLWELLRAWVQNAPVFRGPTEVVQIVRRIRIEPSRFGQTSESEDQASQELQGWLLFHGALSCGQRNDWIGWQIFFDALNLQQNQEDRFFVLLRTAEHLREVGETDRVQYLLNTLLKTFQPTDLEVIHGQRLRMEAMLSMANLVFDVMGDSLLAHRWLDNVSPVPLQDAMIPRDQEPSLEELRFQHAQLSYLLGESGEPEDLLRTAEAHTTFGSYVVTDNKAGLRQIALALYSLARLWVWGHRGSVLQPIIFLQEVRWILDLLGAGYTRWPMSFRLNVSGARSLVLNYIVKSAAQHGSAVLTALIRDFETRWTDAQEGNLWGSELRRKLVLTLVEFGADCEWAKSQLHQIAPAMLRDRDPYGRVEECEKQAKAWLVLDNKELALAELGRMVEAARGIRSEKDYQLPEWVEWLQLINKVEPEHAERRIRLMLRRILSVDGSASGVADAANRLVEVVFEWSPRRSVRLLQGLLEHHVIGHQGGVAHLLRAALGTSEPPVVEVLHSAANLILPLAPGTESELVKKIIVEISKVFGSDTASEVARYLTARIRSDVLVDRRPSWLRSVAAGLQSISVPLSEVGLALSELDEQEKNTESGLDRNFYLRTGEKFTPDEVVARVQTISDLRALLENEDQERTKYFEWSSVTESLLPQLRSVEELRECEQLFETRLDGSNFNQSLIGLSKRFLELGDRVIAQRLAERVLNVTEASGWDPYWDGGVRHAALRQLITIDPSRTHDWAIQMYAHDLSERFRYPGRIIVHLHDVLKLLTEELPVASIWSAIETYLDDLFSSVLVASQPALESCLDDATGTLVDKPDRAVADLLALYLEHPSYPVAQAAVRASTALLLNGSQAIVAALRGALTGNDQAIERALMVLDAVSLEALSPIEPFAEALEQLSASPNFALRLLASTVRSRITDEPRILIHVKRNMPPIYTLHLPELARYKTEQVVQGNKTPAVIEDPAFALRPFDMQIRAVARAVELPEDNVLYRAMQHLRVLESRRLWLGSEGQLDGKRLSHFLDQVGLRYTFHKPRIMPARYALAYVVAELYDGGYFPPEALPWLSQMLINYDPAFILELSGSRPSFIKQIGGVSPEDRTYRRFSDDWIDRVQESLTLLQPLSTNGRVLIGERTHLKYLGDGWPQEERMSVVRPVPATRLWKGYTTGRGLPPFPKRQGVLISDYLHIAAPLDHLVLAHDGFEFETPGANWLALNPAVGRALGWHPIDGGWFRWANEEGVPVAESVWWSDGSIDQANEHLYIEVGEGWLVLVSEQGFQEITKWTPHISRGGVVWRSKGWHGQEGWKDATGQLLV